MQFSQSLLLAAIVVTLLNSLLEDSSEGVRIAESRSQLPQKLILLRLRNPLENILT